MPLHLGSRAPVRRPDNLIDFVVLPSNSNALVSRPVRPPPPFSWQLLEPNDGRCGGAALMAPLLQIHTGWNRNRSAFTSDRTTADISLI